MKVYLNASAWNRPFDDQTKVRIQNETKAIIEVLTEEDITVVISDFLVEQLQRGRDSEKCEAVRGLILFRFDEEIGLTSNIYQDAKVLRSQCRLSRLEDALHILLACEMSTEHFITTDDELVKKKRNIQDFLKQNRGIDINIKNPITFKNKFKLS